MAKQIVIHLHPGKAAIKIITEMDFYKVLVRGKSNDKKKSNKCCVCCVYKYALNMLYLYIIYAYII